MGAERMKRQTWLTALLFAGAFLFLSACSLGNSNTSWAYAFVAWEGNTYQKTDEYADVVEEEIGEVTMYSDHEGTYTGNFSNEYQKGTKYFAIPGTSTDEAIAVQEKDGRYRKMVIVPE